MRTNGTNETNEWEGTPVPSRRASGGDGQDQPFPQKGMEAATPRHGLGLLIGGPLLIVADGVPLTGSGPILESVAVDSPALAEQNEQLGIIVVVDDQSPAAHGAAVDRVPQAGHGFSGDGADDGGGDHGRGVGG